MNFFLATLFVLELSLASTPTLTTTSGPVTGFYQGSAQFFLGIPYAQPPIGSLRWQPPQAAQPWATPYNASAYGACCPQNPMWPDRNLPTDEDCLSLNIYAPLNLTDAPIFVWIHGGAFVGGCSAQKMFDGLAFAQSGTVLVTINYRLGALGFLCNSFLPDFTGNFGFLDQHAALAWVKQNQAALGGGRITVGGESAGAMSVTAHLVSPLPVYFDAAIIESNPATLRYRTISEMAPHAADFCYLVKCQPTDLDCLLAVPVADLLTAQYKTVSLPLTPSLALTEFPWELTLDSQVLLDQPLHLFAQGKFAQVPILIGHNRNESNSFGYQLQAAINLSVDALLYESVVALFFQEHAETVLSLYPAEDNSFDALLRLTTDYIFACPTRAIARNASVTVPVYYYQFLLSSHDDYVNTWPGCFLDGVSCHAAEIPYVFDTPAAYEYLGFYPTPPEVALGIRMNADWQTFIASGSPWPLYQASTLLSKQFNDTDQTVSNYNSVNCDFWDSIGYDW